MKDVPPSSILNYHETNLTDYLGLRKVIMKRSTKYPECIMNITKSVTSIMYDVHMVIYSPRTVYRATHMYNTWTMGGPHGTYYNGSQSTLMTIKISYQTYFTASYLKKI